MSNQTLSQIKLPQGYSLRSIQNGDEEGVAQVISQAWKQLCEQTGTHSDLESIDVTRDIVKWFVHDPQNVLGWVITLGEEIVGVTFLSTYSDKVDGGEIIAVSPNHQGKSLGRILTNLLIQHSTSPSIRLTQDSFNTASFSLYLDCGFDPVEYLSCIECIQKEPSPSAPKKGSTLSITHNGTSLTLRPMAESDLDAVDALFRECNDCSRKREDSVIFSMSKNHESSTIPYVLFEGSKLLAYSFGFHHGGYTVARSEDLLKILVENYSLMDSTFLCYVSSLQHVSFVRWLLQDKKKFKLHRNVTLMSKGWYSPPKYIYLPNVVW